MKWGQISALALGVTVAVAGAAQADAGAPAATRGAVAEQAAAPSQAGRLTTRNVGRYQNREGGLVYFGEVVNAGPAPVGGVGVLVTLSDSRGKPVGRAGTLRVSRNVLKPGESAYWVVHMTRKPARWSRMSVRAASQLGADAAVRQDYRQLRTTGPMAIEQGNPVSNKVQAQVRNTGTQTAEVAAVTAGVYDTRGKLVRVTDQGQLYKSRPGQTLAPGTSAKVILQVIGFKQRISKVVIHYRASTKGPNGAFLP